MCKCPALVVVVVAHFHAVEAINYDETRRKLTVMVAAIAAVAHTVAVALAAKPF